MMSPLPQGARAIQITKSFPAPRTQIFRAFTVPEELARWWGPEATAQTDLRAGGHYRLTMRFGGHEMCTTGTYVEVDAPQKLVFTFAWEGEQEMTLVTIEFREQGDGTEVVITHEGFSTEEAASNHQQGWIDCTDRIYRTL